MFFLLLQDKSKNKHKKTILMESRTAKWFEVRVSYEKQMGEGEHAHMPELYVVDALTFGEAEERVTKEVMPFVNGNFEVKAIAPAAYSEIFFSNDASESFWYKVKLQFIILDEKSGKEKRANITYLVQAGTLNGAVRNVEEIMQGSMQQFAIANISETKVMDVFVHQA